MELDELLLEREFRRMSPDWETSTLDEKVAAFTYFCENYWHIRIPRKRIKLKLSAAQVQTIGVWIGERQSITLKARQVGFSTLAGAYAFWLAFFYDNNQILMISKGEREAKKLLQKARYGYRFLDDWLKLRGPHCDPNTEKMTFHNESYIESLPSAADPARGETASLVFVDEMGQLPNSEEAWASLEPVADVGGQIIMLGTANGEGNLFHQLWCAAKGEWGNGTNDFVQIFHSWRAAEHRDDAWYESQKRKLPEWQLAQEYPDNPDEAFLKSGRPVFNMEALRSMLRADPIARGYLFETDQGVAFREDGGALRIWKYPTDGHRYSMGVDVAEGLEHGDYTSIHVIDVKTDEVVAHWHGHIDPDLLGSDLAPLIGRYYNHALAMVEINNHGLTTMHALQRAKYFPIWRRRRLDNKLHGMTEALGWATTAKSKPKAIDELNMAIRDGGLVVYDKDTVAEMRHFVREGDGKMHGSPHDDRVMSLAIANQGCQYVHLHEYKIVSKPGPGTFGWWMNQTHLWSDEAESEPLIGASAHYGR
jgi:hypothetical protein